MVTRDWFVTAAHCFINTLNPNFYRIQIAATTLVGADAGEQRRAAQVVIHPDYDEYVLPVESFALCAPQRHHIVPSSQQSLCNRCHSL
jgi:hypothetical protein